MRVTTDGVCSQGNDICNTCIKDNTECVFKKALSNYHSGVDISLSLMLTNCPEYISSNRISWNDFGGIGITDGPYATLNPNVVVRLNTGERDNE